MTATALAAAFATENIAAIALALAAAMIHAAMELHHDDCTRQNICSGNLFFHFHDWLMKVPLLVLVRLCVRERHSSSFGDGWHDLSIMKISSFGDGWHDLSIMKILISHVGFHTTIPCDANRTKEAYLQGQNPYCVAMA